MYLSLASFRCLLTQSPSLCGFFWLYSFSGAAITKFHKLGQLKKNRNVFSYSSGGSKSEIKGLIKGSFFLRAQWRNLFLSQFMVTASDPQHSLAYRCISPAGASIFTQHLPSVSTTSHSCIPSMSFSSSYKDTSYIRLRLWKKKKRLHYTPVWSHFKSLYPQQPHF